MDDATLTPTDNGPYLVQGNITVLDAEGNRHDARLTVVGCGRDH